MPECVKHLPFPADVKPLLGTPFNNVHKLRLSVDSERNGILNFLGSHLMLSLKAVVRGLLNLSGMFNVILLLSALFDVPHELSLSVTIHHLHESSGTNVK